MPGKQLKEGITYIRRGAWHLRKGGAAQLRAFRTRQHIVTGADARPTITKQSPLTKLFGRASTPALTLDFPEASFENLRPAPFGDLKVAVILDDFSMVAWSLEFDTVALTPDQWRTQLQGVDLLFVESAWNGNQGAWQYKLTGKNAPAPELTELTTYCRENGIPSIFWNKEDPPHFEDFLPTAALFDHVFTSDSNKIPDYKERLGHERIDVLPFAASDAIHNPIRPPHGSQERDVAFAGMYFAHKYPERRQQMDLLLGAAHTASAKMETGLEIFSRFYGKGDDYQFPAPFDTRVVGSLPYTKMLTAYKAYKVFLNVNSVVDSPSMCARRVFEITASGSTVVSTPSQAIPRYFTQQEVPLADTQDDATNLLLALVNSPELRDRGKHLAQRKIWRQHTYSHRALQLLEAAGLAKGRTLDLPAVSVLAPTNRPQQLEHLLETVASFTGVDLELNLLTHGFEPKQAELRARARDLGLELNLLSTTADKTLGDCLNLLVESASAGFVTKVDDDDLYGSHYLEDLLYAQRFSGADIVGKQAHYMHLTASGATVLRNPEREHRWTDFVMGPTLTGAREVFATHPFASLNRGEDTAFLQSVIADSGRIYSADRYNFTQVRGASGVHSWDIDDAALLAGATVQFFGRGTEHTMF